MSTPDSEVKKLLLVEDDEQFRTALKLFLKTKKFDVIEAADGVTALECIAKNNFDVILSDIRMPKMTGTELLQKVRQTSQVPFVLMTGFSDIMEVDEAHKLGASDFVTKPFKPQELFETLKTLLSPKGTTSSDAGEKSVFDFCAVNIDDFLGSPSLQMDVYVRLSNAKFVKIAHKGTPVSAENIKLYKSKGITVLYILAADFELYVNLNIQVADRLTQKNEIPYEVKVKIIRHTNEVLLRDIFLQGLDKEKVESTSSAIRSTLSVLSRDRKLFDLVETINGFSDHLYAHSLGVSVYSVMIAQAMGWHSTPVHFKLSMAGLLHDIGKKEISRTIVDKPRNLLTPEEVAILESHAFRGKEILSSVPGVPGEVIQIVLQHHENGYGRGPQRLKPQQMHPLAKVVALANRFCELAVINPNQLFTPTEAIERLVSSGVEEFDKECLTALCNLFSYPLDKKTA